MEVELCMSRRVILMSGKCFDGIGVSAFAEPALQDPPRAMVHMPLKLFRLQIARAT
jgi:hypothetical protein